jgi:hypothetical protein
VGQPGHSDGSGCWGNSPTESFVRCVDCHRSLPPFKNDLGFRHNPEDCKFFKEKKAMGLIGANGCESFELKGG